MTSRVRRWEDLRENLQQHIRILTDEAWPLEVRAARQALLRPSLSAGWSLTEHAALTRSSYFSGEGTPPCHSLQCAQCPIGEVTLRSAVMLTAGKDLLQTLKLERPEATRNLVTYSLWDTLGKIDSLLFLENDITWQDILNSGWPIFAILASLATLITGNKFEVVDDDLKDFRQDLAQVLRPQSLEEEVSSYLGPDMLRYRRWLQLATERQRRCWPPTVLSTFMLADGARSLGMPLPVEDFLRIAQSDLRSCRGPMESFMELLKWPWPLFETVDWLQTPAEVRVQISPSRLQQSLWWFKQQWWWLQNLPESTGKLVVPRGRRPQTFGFVGDNIRSMKRPHCNLIFQNAFDTLVEFVPNRRIQVVDVGSMLGDCCLWTLKRREQWAALGWSQHGSCRAYESNELWVRLAGTTAELNGFREEMQVNYLTVLPEGPTSLDTLLKDVLGDDLWVLKIHTDGSELDLLRGAFQILSSGKVHLAVLRMDWQLQLDDGRYRPPPSRWRSFLKSTGLWKLFSLRFCREQAVLILKSSRASYALLRRNLNFTAG